MPRSIMIDVIITRTEKNIWKDLRMWDSAGKQKGNRQALENGSAGLTGDRRNPPTSSSLIGLLPTEVVRNTKVYNICREKAEPLEKQLKGPGKWSVCLMAFKQPCFQLRVLNHSERIDGNFSIPSVIKKLYDQKGLNSCWEFYLAYWKRNGGVLLRYWSAKAVKHWRRAG